MRLRIILPVLMIGAGLLLPFQPAAQAKISYVHPKNNKYKASRKFKGSKDKRPNAVQHNVPKRH